MTEKVTEGGVTFILEPIVNQDGKKQKRNKDRTESWACSCKPCSVLVFVWGFSCNNCLFQIHHHISISMFFFFLKTQFLYPFVSPLGGFTRVFRITVVLKGPLQLLNRWPQKLSSTLWDVAEFINSVATSCSVSETAKLKKPEYLDHLASQLLWGFSLDIFFYQD